MPADERENATGRGEEPDGRGAEAAAAVEDGRAEVEPDRSPGEADDMRFTVVVPTVQRWQELTNALGALAGALAPRDEAVVVLDADTPDSGGGVPARVRLARNPGARGFGPTCNAGARAARGELLLFLNDDVCVRPTLLDSLAQALEDAAVGAVGPDVVSRALGRSESGTRLFWRHGVLEARQDGLEGSGRVEVPYVCGAALAVRRRDFLRVGGFDERLAPYYWEDVDLCLRLQREVGATVVLAEERVEHAHGATISREPEGRRRLVYERNRFLVTWRALPLRYWPLHLIWLPLRLLAACVREPVTALALPLAVARVWGSGARRD
jgi:GT2 family glycosyltransferase